ncbi:MAG: YCF48-related protein [bacterium]|nr:YCF48-related protein [bacterium]
MRGLTLLSIALFNLAAGQTAVSPHGEFISTTQGPPSPAAQDYSPAPYSEEVAALVDLVNAGDVEDALDLVLAEDTRFTPTSGCFDTGASLAASLRAWGYEVTEDPFFTTLVFSDADSAGENLCAVGQAGLIYTSSDGGFAWTRRDDGSVPASLYEVAYAAADPSKVSAAGSSGTLLQSEDGGATWTAFELPGEGNLTVTALARPSADVIYLAGYTPDGMAALKSTDGGKHWNYLNHGFPAGAVCFGMFFLDEDTGWLCGGTTGSPYRGCISRTTDGGETWELWSADGPLVVNLSLADADTGFAVGNDYETILCTTDGGASWETVHRFDGPEYEYLGDVVALSATNAVAVGYGGCVLATADGGDTWEYLREPSDLPDEGNRTALVAMDSERWFAAGYGAFELTEDGGIGWTNRIDDLGLPPAVNVFAHKTGASGEPGPLVIAPYDCTSENPWFDAPGADANGSGTAAALVAAKALGALETERDLGFLFTATRYSGGDLGQSGGRRFLAKTPGFDCRAILDLEAVGFWDAGFLAVLLGEYYP